MLKYLGSGAPLSPSKGTDSNFVFCCPDHCISTICNENNLPTVDVEWSKRD